jgi:hypothetical protein
MSDYLPEWATADEATAWLEKRTGEPWPLPRILEEVQPGLSVWLEFSPSLPHDVFQGRTEGFLAEIVFHGDVRRLAVARDGLLTMTRRPDGALLSITPGAPFDVGDLRVRGADLEQMAALAPPPELPVPTEAAVSTHTTKRRADPLAAVLNQAKLQALDAADWTSAWAALVALAQPTTRPAPLLGYVEGEGVKYQADDASQPIGWLKRDAFRKRFKRKG